MKPNIKRVLAPESMSFILQIAEDDEYKLHLQRSDKPDETVGLWFVTLVLEREHREFTKLVPSTTCYYVLAEDEEGAISQVNDGPFNFGNAMDGYEAIKDGRMKATAFRVPFHIRGWGSQTF